MRVVVTGGSGYIGSLLIRRLPFSSGFEGCTVRIFDSMAGDKYYSLFDLPDARYEFLLGDIGREEDLRRALSNADIVFDLAGITSVPLSYRLEERTMKVNVEGAKRLAEVAADTGVERIIYASSAAVYGNVNGIVAEDHPCNPESPYAKSKFLAEQVYLQVWKESGLKVSILRLGTVYGYAPGMRFDTVVNRFAFLAAIGEPFTVWRGAEEALRPYLYVGDAIEAFLLVAVNPATVGRVFNVTTENASLLQVIGAIRKCIPDVKVKVVEPPYKQQTSYGLNDSMIRALGYQPKGSLEKGVKEVVERFKAFLR
ncbi:MAG: NAD-dependent epimerase/dehydratase family protein [Thermofilaceae archaeon]